MGDDPPLGAPRWAEARIDLDAVAHNVGVMRRITAPAAVWAVVKADGYGHGSVPVAREALRAGAEGLCVALVQEGVELRRAGIDAPVLVLSQQPSEQLDTLVGHRLIPTLYSHDAVAASYSDRVVFLADGHITDQLTNPTPDAVLDHMRRLGN